MKLGANKQVITSSGGVNYILPGLTACTKKQPPTVLLIVIAPFLIAGVLAMTFKSFLIDMAKGNLRAWK
jgi:hypothetical protein